MPATKSKLPDIEKCVCGMEPTITDESAVCCCSFVCWLGLNLRNNILEWNRVIRAARNAQHVKGATNAE